MKSEEIKALVEEFMKRVQCLALEVHPDVYKDFRLWAEQAAQALRDQAQEIDKLREALRLAKALACRCNEEGHKCSLCNAMESAGLESSAEYWRTVPRQSLNPKEPKEGETK